jgi:biotin operon repressor
MNQDTYRKIEGAVPFLSRYFELDKSEQAWIYPYLDKSIKSTIKILNLIIDTSLTYEEIAEDLGINKNTVIQKINALGDGGFPLEIKPDKALYAPSRKRDLVRRADKFAKLDLLEKVWSKNESASN